MKTELDSTFDYKDDPEFVRQNNWDTGMAFFFSLPFIGWYFVIMIVLAEWLWKKLRLIRLYLLIVWRHLIC